MTNKPKHCDECSHIHKQDDRCATDTCECIAHSHVVPDEVQLKLWAYEFANMRYDAFSRFAHYLAEAFEAQRKADKLRGYTKLANHLYSVKEYLDIVAIYSNDALNAAKKYMRGAPAYISYLSPDEKEELQKAAIAGETHFETASNLVPVNAATHVVPSFSIGSTMESSWSNNASTWKVATYTTEKIDSSNTKT